jgi:predicted Zn-dependent protease
VSRFKKWIALVSALGLLVHAVRAGALPPGSTPREIELGDEAAEDISKAVSLVNDEKTLAKVRSILEEIAAVTERPAIRYEPHIVSSPLVNAFVIPGGRVYLTTGLLEAVESDDELAGVLAHEIAHNVNQHAIERMRNVPKGLGLLQLASIAALIIGGSPEAAVLVGAAANTITAAVLNGGTIAAEKEADACAIRYLTRTKYNPTGFLTFMEKLAGSAGKFIEEELGIYRTHPLTRDRVDAAREALVEYQVPILRRLVTESPQPESREIVIDGAKVTEIVYLGQRLLLLDGHDDTRTDACLAAIRWTLDYELDNSKVKIIPAVDGVVFAPEAGPPFRLSSADGALAGQSEAVLAGELRGRLAKLVADAQARIRANYQLY